MSRAIDQEHGLDDFDEEEKRVDPMIMGIAILVLLSVIGLSFGYVIALFFR